MLVLLNLLAFLMHTILDLGDEAYQRIRRVLGTRQTFNNIQALTRYWFFANWNNCSTSWPQDWSSGSPNLTIKANLELLELLDAD